MCQVVSHKLHNGKQDLWKQGKKSTTVRKNAQPIKKRVSYNNKRNRMARHCDCAIPTGLQPPVQRSSSSVAYIEQRKSAKKHQVIERSMRTARQNNKHTKQSM